jgi:hypothetical protein
MTIWKQPPSGGAFLLCALGCAVGPLLLRGLLHMDLGSLETLLFGVSTRGSSGAGGLFPGELLSSLDDGLAALRENLFLLIACWAQPGQVVLHLAEVESQWFNPITALLGIPLLCWPVIATASAALRRTPLPPPTRILVLLLSAATGIAAVLPQGGAMIAVSVLLLPPFVTVTYGELAQRAKTRWLPPILCWGYLLAIALDLGIAWWLLQQL